MFFFTFLLLFSFLYFFFLSFLNKTTLHRGVLVRKRMTWLIFPLLKKKKTNHKTKNKKNELSLLQLLLLLLLFDLQYISTLFETSKHKQHPFVPCYSGLIKDNILRLDHMQ